MPKRSSLEFKNWTKKIVRKMTIRIPDSPVFGGVLYFMYYKTVYVLKGQYRPFEIRTSLDFRCSLYRTSWGLDFIVFKNTTYWSTYLNIKR
jgi:hypothetical protein